MEAGLSYTGPPNVEVIQFILPGVTPTSHLCMWGHSPVLLWRGCWRQKRQKGVLGAMRDKQLPDSHIRPSRVWLM